MEYEETFNLGWKFWVGYGVYITAVYYAVKKLSNAIDKGKFSNLEKIVKKD